MTLTSSDHNEHFRELSELGRIGWWEADFSAKQYLCSDYVCKLLGLKEEYLTFSDFGAIIREDYRARIVREFLSIEYQDVYEQTFPIYAAEGLVWVHSRMGKKEVREDGVKAFGVLQYVDMPKNEQESQAMRTVNDLLYRQNSISHSLQHFLHEEGITTGIYEMLHDILGFFQGGRTYIFEYDADYEFQSCTYEVVASGVMSEKDSLQQIPTKSLPWWTLQILDRKPILLESLSDLPNTALGEYDILSAQNIKSLMVIPMVSGDRVCGYMGVDLVDGPRIWSNEDYQWLSSLTNIISICIELRKNKDEAVQIHKALDRSEKLFKNLFANIPVGLEIYNCEGNLLDLNNKDMEIFGVMNKEAVLGVNLFQNPNVPNQLRERIQTEDGVDFRLDYAFERAEGYYSSSKSSVINLYTKVSKIYDSKGDFTGYAMINIDNTERMDVLGRISDFENFFLLISDYAKVGYAKLNLLDGKGYAIKQWYKNMGEYETTELSEVVGVYAKMHPDDRKLMHDFFRKARLGTEKAFKKELRVLRLGTKNEWNWVRTNVVVNLYDPDNGLIEIIGVNYDITELKETEAMLIDAKDKAETADRLKTAFLANMSHEIRTPLNAIVGFSSLMSEIEDPEEKKEYMALVEENNGLLLQLISDILDLSKIEAGTFDFSKQQMDVNSLCEDVVRSMQMKAKPSVEIILDPHPSQCMMVSDRNRINQVISNFVNNAIKFTQIGSIHVGYEVVDEEHLRFYVSDTGIGIPAQKKEEIFQRFVKLNTFVNGTGLGLSISKSIIEQLGGTIGVDSEEGKGSCFWFILPIA